MVYFLRLSAAAAVLVFFEARAHAYLDPGTGSFVMQAAIAIFVSAGFAVKTFWKQIKGFFLKHSVKPAQGKDE